ncbi:T9SS type A sorting domain-containing protein [Gracilimonas sp. BCB1]|uniref:T9SS type A sorting domain-containing protein n=1 Tax=Gracilimonas sp. BCB1 TaxID=3152362 RepID=UPI003F864BE6
MLFISMGAINVFAQTTTWTGSVNSDWNNASNWDNGVPGSGSRVIISNQTNKPILNTSATVERLEIGKYGSGSGITYLTVISGGDLTITNRLELNGTGGSLHIDGGTVNHTGTNFSFGYNANRYVEMTSGSFSTNANVSLTGGNTSQPAFSAGNGVANFNGNLTVNSSDKRFDAGSGTINVAGNLNVGNNSVFNLATASLTVDGTTTINGDFNGDDGMANFEGPTEVKSNGVLNLNDGNLIFNSSLNVESNGYAYLGSGTVEINDDVQVQSSGYFYVQDATVNINGNADFSSNGNLYVDTGTINVAGNASVTSGGSMSLGSGNLELSGDFEVTGGSDFNADSSTVTFSGDSTQTIITNGNDITFNDVVVDSGATFQTDGDSENVVTVEGDLTVNEGGSVNVQDDDQLDIQGEVNGDGADNVQSPAPFAVSASAPDVNTVVITFNKDMVESLAENVSNYEVERVSNSNSVSVNSASLNTGGNSRQVTLSIGNILEDVEYRIIINNLESTDGGELSDDHIKRFSKSSAITFYSRRNGRWDRNSTWSTTGHDGAAASSNPSNTNNATIFIGGGDNVRIITTESIVNQNSLEILSGALLRVHTNGTLTVGEKIITGSGEFRVTNGTLEIGSADGIATSGATGNIQTGTRNFRRSGSYTYNGSSAQITGNGLPNRVNNLTINNSSEVSLDNDIEVEGTLSLTSGILSIESGINLIANTKAIGSGKLRMKNTIGGSNGWRLLSSPLQTDFDDLLDKTVTQGYSGAYYPTGSNPGDTLQPNVLYYDETYPGTDNQRWRAPSNASNSISEGLGLFTYIFGDIDADPNYNDVFPLPLTLDVEGQENEGPVDFGVTYTPSADSGWNLVGNPYAATIDWDEGASWTKTNIDQTIYIWDYSSNQFLTWNGTTGDLGDGLISPFQGFWVKANAPSPSLIVEEDAKTTGGSYVGKSNSMSVKNHHPMFSISLVDDENREVSAHFMFTESANYGKDRLDGYRLNPFSGISDYIELSSVSASGDKYAINNLPRHFGIPIEIPLQIEAYENGVSASGNMYLKLQEASHLPHGWTISLIDRKLSEEISLERQPSYIFNHIGESGKKAANNGSTARPKIQSKANPDKTRFVLRINPGADAGNLPSDFRLEQNYPNPFNPATKIQFDLPLKSYTELEIFDILGRKITTLVDGELRAGTHVFNWDASQFSSGIYLYRLVTRNGVFTKKMTLIK